MTTFDSDFSGVSNPGRIRSAIRALKRCRDHVRRVRAWQRASNELRQFPDHVLHDMGISRSEIDFAVRGGVPEPRRVWRNR